MSGKRLNRCLWKVKGKDSKAGPDEKRDEQTQEAKWKALTKSCTGARSFWPSIIPEWFAAFKALTGNSGLPLEIMGHSGRPREPHFPDGVQQSFAGVWVCVDTLGKKTVDDKVG